VVVAVQTDKLLGQVGLAVAVMGQMHLQPLVLRELQIVAVVVVGVVLVAPLHLTVLAERAAQAWSLLETAEQPHLSQVPLQLQWLVVTLYIRSLATVQ
jgi:hypothetical protein